MGFRISLPGYALTACCALALGNAASAGTWTPLSHPAPGGVNLMLLLSDGTVMAAQNDGASIGSGWYRLTPDIHGSYVNGTWSVLATAHDTRLYYPSQVLRDGRVFVAGGEYGTGGPKAEVYDPLTNVWTQVNPPSGLWNLASDNFYDCNSEILPDGKVLLMPVFPHTSGIPLLYNPATNTWSNAGHLAHGTWQDEASWAKLPDDSILTIDPFGTLSERYIPATNTWVADSNVPVSLYDPFGFELGAGVWLDNIGRAFFLGSTGHTALYTPTGNTSPGVWVAGPDIPGSHGTPDAPACVMIDGKVLCAVSPLPTSGNHFPSPTTFYEYSPLGNSFASVNAPTGASEPGACYGTQMLQLPDGNVLFSHFSTQLHVYTPSGAPLASGKPTVSSLTQNLDGSYHLTGTLFNGISEGASYGDDFQMNSNYPLVRLTGTTGNIYYARTYNWSGTSISTGSATVSTEFRTPASLPVDTYTLEVVANGIASNSVPFSTGCSPAQVYCTSKISSSFCVPNIAPTGTPTASFSAAAAFTFQTTGMEDNKSALNFWSASGPASSPFQGGTLCVAAPVFRLPVQNTGGAGACLGAITNSLADIMAHPAGGLAFVGATINCQTWGRDPGDFFGTSLSNGVQFLICP